MNLGNWLAEQITEEDSKIKNIVAIYPGRFQPMGKHHAAVYNKLLQHDGLNRNLKILMLQQVIKLIYQNHLLALVKRKK